MSQEAQTTGTATAAPGTAKGPKAPKVVKEKVKLVKAILAQEIQDGKKIQYFIDKYELCEAQMRKALKACGLKIRSFQEPQFVFEDEQPANQLGLFPDPAEEATATQEEATQDSPEEINEVGSEVVDANIQEVAATQTAELPKVDF